MFVQCVSQVVEEKTEIKKDQRSHRHQILNTQSMWDLMLLPGSLRYEDIFRVVIIIEIFDTNDFLFSSVC